jgi:hypothetical protein
MRSEIVRHDSISTDSFQAPINITQVEYMWFDTAYGLPVMTANGTINGSTEVMGTIEYIHDHTCATPTWDVEVSYVEDSTGTIVTHFDVLNNNADEYTWDWGDGQFDVTTGSTTHVFPEGSVQAVGVTGCMLHCLPLNSCAFRIFDLEIPTAVKPIDAQQAGIRIFPNPAGDILHIRLAESIGSATYTVLDMNGKALLDGNVSGENQSIHTATLIPGMYTVIFVPNTNDVQPYYVRFAIQR